MYARSDAYASPRKERPNTGKSRSAKPPVLRAGSSSPGSPGLTDSDSTARSSKKGKDVALRLREAADYDQHQKEQRKRERKRKEEAADKRARAEAKAAKDAREPKSPKKTRPAAPKHSATQPVVQQLSSRANDFDEASYYGIQSPATSGPRPRAQTRPASYYAGQASRPPPANMGWYQSHQSQLPFPVGTYPPQAQMMTSNLPGYGIPVPTPPAPPPEYLDRGMTSFHHEHLRQRFENRPSSVGGIHPQMVQDYHRGAYEEAQEPKISRRGSRSKKQSDDRKKMPPPEFIPMRPRSALPVESPFKPPPPPPFQRTPSHRDRSRPPASHRRSVNWLDQGGYEDEDLRGDDALFHDMSPPTSYERPRRTSSRSRRESVAYDDPEYGLTPARSRTRPSSGYGAAPLGSGGVSLEDERYMDAVNYQDRVGGKTVPLTAESLRKASKRGGGLSSQSTKSSASRDESDYRRSNTTGITRSSSGNAEDITVKVQGAAVVRWQGAEIECDGGEITFSSRATGSRGGSERSSDFYQLEDARSRMGRKTLPQRTRAPSQSDSHSRGYAYNNGAFETAYAGGNFI